MKFRLSVSKLVALVGVFIAMYGIYGIHHRFSSESPAGGMQAILSQDVRQLEKGNDQSPEYYQAVLRIAQNNKERIEGTVQELLESAHESDQVIGLQALGFFDDSAKLLERYSQCLEKNGVAARVQEACIIGLGNKKSEQREQILESWLGSWVKSETPYWRALESLYSVTNSPEKQHNIRAALKDWIRVHPSEKALVPFLLLMRWSPHDQDVEKMALEFIETSKNPKLQQVAISYLAQRENAELHAKLPGFLESKDEALKLGMLKSLHITCPVDRLKLIAGFLNQEENKKYLPQVLEELFLLGDSGAFLILDQARTSSFWTLQDLARMDEATAKMKLEFRRDKEPCRVREK